MFFEEYLLRREKLTLEEMVSKACENKELPGVVLIADGGEDYHLRAAFGSRSVDKSSEEPVTVDTPFVLSSCTRLITTIAALQCVERGLLELDEDVTVVLPELRGRKILTGFDPKNERPILTKSSKPMTLRQLLTHTSGLSTSTLSPLLRRYLYTTSTNPTTPSSPTPITTTRPTLFSNHPLLHEPGTSFTYGPSHDWVSLAITRTTHQPLCTFLKTNIFTPLNMTTAVLPCSLSTRPDISSSLPDTTYRLGLRHPLYETVMSERGILVSAAEMEASTETSHSDYSEHSQSSTVSSEGGDDGGGINNGVVNGSSGGASDESGGGEGLICSAADFGRLLRSLACASSQPQILSGKMTEELFSPQLSPPALSALRDAMAIPEVSRVIGGVSLSKKEIELLDWGLGGLLMGGAGGAGGGRGTTDDECYRGEVQIHGGVSGRRRGRGKGAIGGAGETNMAWWCDRRNGVSGVYACQLLPAGDRKSVDTMEVFEEEVYARAGRV